MGRVVSSEYWVLRKGLCRKRGCGERVINIYLPKMSNWKRFTVTAALPYANGPVHIGHLAGCYLPADIYVRYLRANKKDVVFICGSDEHGVPITIKARKEGITPQQVVDKYHHIMKDAFAGFGISFSIYSRTSNKIHHDTASAFFRKLYDQGSFTEQETDQYYDEEVKQFLADRYIVGTCPVCGNENAYGDQCENCGTSLSPTDLKNPHSMLSGSKPVLRKTKNWFLPLDKLQPKVEKYIEKHKDWKVNVYGQCKSWLDSGDGLQPRSMTRDLDWGIRCLLKEPRARCCMFGLMRPLVIYRPPKNFCLTIGRNTGRRRIRDCYTLLERTTLFSTASFFR